MKKILLFICPILLFGCEKDIYNNIKSNPINNADSVFVNPINLAEPDTNYLSYIENTDLDETQKNKDLILYYLGEAIFSVCQNENLVEEIIQNSDEEGLLPISELMNNQEAYDIIENRLTELGQNYSSLVSDLNYDDIDYYPVINIANINSTNRIYDTNPIVAAGVSYSQGATEGNIMAWLNEDNETQTEVLVNESNNSELQIPLFVVTLHTDYIEELDTADYNYYFPIKKNDPPSSFSTWYFNTTGYRINYRYESDNYSNFRYTGFHILRSISNNSLSITAQDVTGGLIDNIHKNYVNTNNFQNTTKSLNLNLNFNSTLYNYVASLLVTYEYDWYATKKTLKINGTYVGTVYVKCSMNNASEWYQIPQTNRNTNATYNSKGYIKISNPY